MPDLTRHQLGALLLAALRHEGLGSRDAFEGRQEPLSWFFRALAYDQSELDILESGAVDTLYANTRNNPIEDIESHLPLRVDRYELREDVCGAGQWRGGLGSVREFVYLDDGAASVEGEGHRFAPWGFRGGSDGATAGLRLDRKNGKGGELPSKVPHTAVQAGDRFVCVGPAGGGYGDPLLRDPAQVLSDVTDGLISIDTAVKDYGVVITKGLAIDEAATAQRRS